jgi:hypothetical protein
MTDSTAQTWKSAGSSLDGDAIAGLLAAVRQAHGSLRAYAALSRMEGREARAIAMEELAGIMEDAIAKVTKTRADQ